jgi:hypothetical protein
MTIIRVEKPETNFTVVPNHIIQNKDLSAPARLLWILLMSLPDTWTPRMSHLAAHVGVGRDKMQMLCKELEAANLLSRKPKRAADGTVNGQVWELDVTAYLENRQAAEPADGVDRQAVGKAPYKENRTIKETEVKKTESKDIRETVENAVEIYNSACTETGWPKVQKITDTRRKHLLARLKDCGGLEGWRAAIDRARQSDFLCGRTNSGWTGSFDFLTNQSNFTKLNEGNYDNRNHNTRSARGGISNGRKNGSDAALNQILRAAGKIPAPKSGRF